MPTADFITRTSARLSAAGVGGGLPLGSPFDTGSTLDKITLDDLYGITRGMSLSRGQAMKFSPISKARRVLCGNLSRLTFRTVKNRAEAPVPMSLLQQPERDVSLANSLAWLADDLLFNPKAWWIVQERDSYGWPLWVKRLPREKAGYDKDGKLAKAWGADVAARDVIEFQSIDAGLLEDASTTLTRAYAVYRAASLAEDNPVPSIDLHNSGEDLEDPDIDDLIKRWTEARRKGGVGYTSKTLEAKALGIAPQQLLIDARKTINAELARHTGIPAWALDIAVEGQSLTYTNRASRNAELIDLGLSPYMTAIASRLSMGDVTPRGWHVEFDTDVLTRDDMKTRFETYQIGKNSGFVDNEWIAEQERWARVMNEGAPE